MIKSGDDHLISELELIKTDFSVISQKLESKSQAVLILQDSLRKCEKERDEFKRMAEQVMTRYQLLRKTICQDLSSEPSPREFSQLDRKQLIFMLLNCREANKNLQEELMEMKTKLRDASGDIKLLRKQQNAQVFGASHSSKQQQTELNEKEKWLCQLEAITTRAKDLERELARCCDELQEMRIERDVFRNKCDRLNNELNYILSGDERKIVDIDALITEKKSLLTQLRVMEEEKRLAMTTLAKYQRMLERKPSKSSSVGSDCPFSPALSPVHQANTPVRSTNSSSADATDATCKEGGIKQTDSDANNVAPA